MIKVFFSTKDYSEINIEKELDICQEVEEWLELNVDGLSFDCMDFPSDAVHNYVCYFRCTEEPAACDKLYSIVRNRMKPFCNMRVEISRTKEIFGTEELIYKIEC